MAMAGFHEVAASEQDDAAAATYLYNLADRECEVHYLAPGDEARAKRAKFEPGANPHRPEWAAVEGCLHFYFGDCRQLTGQRVLADLGMVPTEIDVVHGGPPCQGLSTMNSKRCIEEPRNALLWEFCRLVEEIRPKCFLMENVPPLLSAARGDLFRCLCRRMNQAGYDVVANILDAVGYGVPQYRRRALVVGTLAEMGARAKFQFPIPSHWGIVAPAGGEFHHTPGFFEHYGMDGGDVEYDEEAGTFRGGDIGDTRPRVKSPQAALDLDGETA
jgi:site-specific DNA-cytosine methylase